MKTIKTFISLFLILSCHATYGQESAKTLLKVINNEGNGVHDAVVLIDDINPLLTDENGYALFTNLKEGKVRIIIKHLSYLDFDTMVIFPLLSSRLILRLQNKINVLDEVTVTAKPSITEKQASYITDIYLHENHILALFSNSKETSIRFFDSLGMYTDNYFRFTTINNAQKLSRGFLPSSFYMIGAKQCLSFSCHISPTFHIAEQEEITSQQYKKTIESTIYYNRKQLIKKEVSNFSNYVKLYLYDTHSLERQLLYEMFDRQYEEIALYNYNKVKAIYLRSIQKSNEKDIDYGFTRINVLEDPNWKGDILDLYVSNAQQLYLIMYQVATQGLIFDTKIREKGIWVVDNVNCKLVTSPLDEIRMTPFIALPESKKPFTFVQSEHLICIENGDAYYYLDELRAKWVPLNVADSNVFYPKRKILLGNYMYILGRSDAVTPQNTVMKFKVFE